jgi:indole-3-glycerol phosphate synthase
MILDEILAHKRTEIAGIDRRRVERVRPSLRSLLRAISTGRREVALLAEIKRASPSEGILRDPLDASAIARDLEAAGAAAISVVTDARFFGGSLESLRAVSGAVSIPVLRKDFILDPAQILEARYHGADSVLLLAGALDRRSLAEFLRTARALMMEPLVEAHTGDELEAALSAGAFLVGINNRDLATMKVDAGTTRALAGKVPASTALVSESGIAGPADVRALRGVVDAVLVGTALMRAPDPGALAKELVEAGTGGDPRAAGDPGATGGPGAPRDSGAGGDPGADTSSRPRGARR